MQFEIRYEFVPLCIATAIFGWGLACTRERFVHQSNSSMDTTLKEKHLGTHSQLKKINREIN